MVSEMQVCFLLVLAFMITVSRGQRIPGGQEELPMPPPSLPSAAGPPGMPSESMRPGGQFARPGGQFARPGGQFDQREERGFAMPPSPFDEGPRVSTNPSRFKEMIENLRTRWSKIAAQLRNVVSKLRSIDVDGDTATASGVPSPPTMPREEARRDEATRLNAGVEYSRRYPRN